MASYVENVLGKGEEVLYRAHVSWWGYFWTSAFGALVLFSGLVSLFSAGKQGGVPILVGLLFLLPGVIALLTTELVITNRRVIAKSGMISRNTVEMNLSKVETLKIQQGIAGRFLGFGTVVVCGTGATQSPIKGIKDPLSFRRAFDGATAHIQ
ncbi:PH domain-containing protein [Polaromonas sp.]|uniref:PH domain-containing protein n=1 Tax=Polaromonas sp. TaxID=1869339 RepID=UPI003BB68E67